MKFRHGVVAGTFDHLHKGHQALLVTALSHSKKMSVGLTQESLAAKKSLPALVQDHQQRKTQLDKFLDSEKAVIFPLLNSLGNAGDSKEYDAIFASTETKGNVVKINRLRVKKGLKPLYEIIIDPITSSDQQRLSSTRIRQGLVNRQGLAFRQVLPLRQKLTLPSFERRHLKNPFDLLIQGSANHLGWAGLKIKKMLDKQKPFMTIAVGDIAVMSLIQQGLVPSLSVIDLKTKREVFASTPKQLGLKSAVGYQAVNPAGSITPELIDSLLLSFNQLVISPESHLTLMVKGEEDLTVLPAVLLAPLTSAIVYGQPDQGLVYIKVTEKTKAKAVKLIKKFI